MRDGDWVIPNGDIEYIIPAFICDCCGIKIKPTDYRRHLKNCQFCLKCAFIKALISPIEYLNTIHPNDGLNAQVHNGKIHIWKGNKKPWERPSRDYRKLKEYRDWRKKVFDRDNYTCRTCGVYSGKLEAHHVRKFHQYPDLRYELSNGITMCRPCHLMEHRRVHNG